MSIWTVFACTLSVLAVFPSTLATTYGCESQIPCATITIAPCHTTAGEFAFVATGENPTPITWNLAWLVNGVEDSYAETSRTFTHEVHLNVGILDPYNALVTVTVNGTLEASATQSCDRLT